MSARDELAAIIARPEDVDHGPLSCGPGSIFAGRVADAILAAGYRKPRTITTVDDLLALKLPAIIDCKNGGVAKVEYMYGPGRQKYAEFLFGDDESGDEIYDLAYFATFALPAEVLKEDAK